MYSFFKKNAKLLTKAVFAILLVSLVFTSLIPPVNAQTKTPAAANFKEDSTGRDISPQLAQNPQSASGSALGVSSENGQVLQSFSCGIKIPIPLAPDLTIDPCSWFSKIFEFFLTVIGKFVVKVMFWVLRIIAAVFGFALDTISTLCGNQEGISGLISDANGDDFIRADLVQRFNLFVVADMGVSGVFQSIPNDTPVTYLASTLNNNILGVQTSFAQGVGTSSLGQTTVQVWEKMRDLAMILMVLVLVAIGFMIMFRRKLSPQTSVTVMNSLPRVAMALILITFSYAIAGLFIDLAYVGVNLVRSYFGNLGVYQQVFGAVSQRMGGELIWFPIFTAFSFGTIFNWAAVLCAFIIVVGGAAATPLLPLSLGAVPAAFLIFMIGVLIVEVLMRLTLFALAVFVFWQLLKTFALMIVYAIFSPMFFLMGALPGFEGTTINWFKRMLANAITFPVILVFLFVALTFIWGSNPIFQIVQGNIQAPPPLGSNLLNIGYLVGMGMTFFASKVPKVIEKMMKLDDFDMKGGVGGGLLLAPITAPGRALGAAGNLGKTVSGLQSGFNTVQGGASLLRNTGWGSRGPSHVAGPGANIMGVPVPEGSIIQAGAPRKEGRAAAIARAAYERAPGFVRKNKQNPDSTAVHPEQNVIITPEQQNERQQKRAEQFGTTPGFTSTKHEQDEA